MAFAVVGGDVFCRQSSGPVIFPMPALVGLSLSFAITSTPALLQSLPQMCSSAGIRSTAGGKRPRLGCCSSRPSRRLFSNCSNAEVLATSRSPWEDALDSFVVDVVEADSRALDVPLLAAFTIATTKLEKVHNVAICVALSDGSVGWGEAPTLPTVTAEDQTVALAEAARACGFLKAQPGRSLREILQQMSLILPGHDFASVRAGMEMAVVDAVARSLKLPLWKFFGGHCSSITTDITYTKARRAVTEDCWSKFVQIPICPAEEAEQLAIEYAARGFATIKTKVGGRALSSDIGLLKAIRRGHPSCSLILDANCGYTADEALQVLRELNDLGLTPSLFEQPVMRDDWSGLGHVCRIARKLYSVPVAADESCRSLVDAKRIVERGLAEVLNVKLAKMGVLEALELVAFARKAGLELMIGGMVETRLAMGFAAHFVGGFIDLDTPLLLGEDPVHGGYKVNGAVYTFSKDHGHGGRLS